MESLKYQVKSVLRDKFCLMTFLLPIVVAIGLSFLGSVDLSDLGEFQFGAVEGSLSAQAVSWLNECGSLEFYPSMEELRAAILEPSTTLIGVVANGDGIRTIVTGDEYELWRQAAAALPGMFDQSLSLAPFELEVLESPDTLTDLVDRLVPAVLIVAMFMGCTFNAMNIIAEKEEGVSFVNEVLPMTAAQYVRQKIAVGFIWGALSSLISAAICLRLPLSEAGLLIVVILLSSFVASLMGLFIGRAAEGMMVGVVYIKIIMIVFIAVPVLSTLLGGEGPLAVLAYVVPSEAAFDGIMALTAADALRAIMDIGILAVHCVVWFLLYLAVSARERREKSVLA